MVFEIILFLIASIVGFIPSIFNMKTDNENAKGWKRLNGWGKAYVIFFTSLVILGLFTIINNAIEKNGNEKTLIEKNKRDSLIHSKERFIDSLSRAKLTHEVAKLFASDSAYKSAIKKGGYTFDPIRGQIIDNRKNIQIVEKGANAFQSNAPNYGTQHVGDIKILLKKNELDEQELSSVTSFFKKMAKENKIDTFLIIPYIGSNGRKVGQQLSNSLTREGFYIAPNYNQAFPPNEGMPDGTTYQIGGNIILLYLGMY